MNSVRLGRVLFSRGNISAGHAATFFLGYWVNLLIIVFLVSALTHEGHGGEAAVVLIFTALLSSFLQRNRDQRLALSRQEKIIVGAILLFLLWSILGAFFQPEGLEFESSRRQWRALDGPSRWLFLLPLFFLFRKVEIDWRWLAWGLSIAIFIAVSIAIRQVYFEGAGRAYGMTGNPIIFGELLVIVDLLTWMLMVYAWNNQRRGVAILLLIASLAAFYGAMLTGTRGALLAYGLMVVVWLVHGYRNLGGLQEKLFSRVTIIRLLGFVVIFSVVSQTDQYRAIEAKSLRDLQRLQSWQVDGVGGGRGEMFKVAIEGVKRYPFGVGTDNYHAILEDLVREGYSGWNPQEKEFLLKFNQAHNEWLNLFIENGIQGLLTIMFMFGYAGKVFFDRLKDKSELVGIYAACGMMLLAGYIVFGMTQAVFSHNSTSIFFILLFYLFLSQVTRAGTVVTRTTQDE